MKRRLANYDVVPGLQERIAFLQRQEASTWATNKPLPQICMALWQICVRQTLIAVLRLADPMCVEAYLQERTLSIANELSMLRNRAGPMVKLNVPRAKRG